MVSSVVLEEFGVPRTSINLVSEAIKWGKIGILPARHFDTRPESRDKALATIPNIRYNLNPSTHHARLLARERIVRTWLPSDRRSRIGAYRGVDRAFSFASIVGHDLERKRDHRGDSQAFGRTGFRTGRTVDAIHDIHLLVTDVGELRANGFADFKLHAFVRCSRKSRTKRHRQ